MTYREYTHTGNPAGSLLSVNVRDVGSRCVVSKKNTAPETTFSSGFEVQQLACYTSCYMLYIQYMPFCFYYYLYLLAF